MHIGLAVSLGEAGLIVPVIKSVDRKGLSTIAADRQDLATRARKSELGGADISGGTFTVSNLGNYGVESFNPIINPPQVAILGVGGIADKVVPVNGAPAIRPIMGLSLSFDPPRHGRRPRSRVFGAAQGDTGSALLDADVSGAAAASGYNPPCD